MNAMNGPHATACMLTSRQLWSSRSCVSVNERSSVSDQTQLRASSSDSSVPCSVNADAMFMHAWSDIGLRVANCSKSVSWPAFSWSIRVPSWICISIGSAMRNASTSGVASNFFIRNSRNTIWSSEMSLICWRTSCSSVIEMSLLVGTPT